LQRQVLRPGRGVGVAPHFGLGGQLEESQDVAVACVEEDVHVGIGLFGGRHLVFGNRQDEAHVEVLLVPLHGLLGVLAAVGDVVNLFDLHG